MASAAQTSLVALRGVNRRRMRRGSCAPGKTAGSKVTRGTAVGVGAGCAVGAAGARSAVGAWGAAARAAPVASRTTKVRGKTVQETVLARTAGAASTTLRW